MIAKKFLAALIICAFLTSCNLINIFKNDTVLPTQVPSTPLAATPFIPTFTLTSTSTPAPVGYFKVVVLVDLSSAPLGEEDASEVLAEASAILFRITGFAFEMIDFATEYPHEGEKRSELPNRYLDEHPDIRPNGIIFYTYADEDYLKNSDAFADRSKSLPGYRNEFGGFDYIPIAVANRYAKYAACGYDETGEKVSDVSSNGECRNQTGVPCTEKNGYSMCADAVNRLYASTENYFISSTIIHEFMHPYGYMDVYQDHYNDICAQRMGWQPLDWWSEEVLLDSELYNGICPDIYPMFIKSYQP